MNRREKILASVVGGIIGLLLLGFAVRAIFLKPVREIEKRTASLRGELARIKTERRDYFAAEDKMKNFALRSFADTIDQSSAKSGEMLTKLILQSGLSEGEFNRLPIGPRKLRGANEIGWSVQGEGPLTNVINLLFLLQESSYLRRMEGLTISAGEAPGFAKVRFRYLTLVMDPSPEVERKELPPRFTLASPERYLFEGIVTRDLLRPYIKRPPPPRVPAPPGSNPADPSSAPGPETFKIVSLSEWMGQPEIHVRDVTAQRTLRFRPGDQLAGGTVVCVDYRPQPMPGNEFLRSDSRVILRMGPDYYAIERGKTLADKRKLATNQLPANLAKVP